MTTAFFSFFMLLWRHKEKIAAVLVVLILAFAMKIDLDKATTDCTPGASGGPGVSGDFAYPTDKAATNISSPYGMRDGAMHRGIDIAGAEGTPIYAFAEGTVADAGPASGFGNWIVIDHTTADGKPYSTVYGHMYDNGVLVQKGQRVSPGQRIGLIGNNGQSFGAHLHFEVWPGTRLNGGSSVDPTEWLQKGDEVQGGEAPAQQLSEQQSSSGGTIVTALRARQIIDVGNKRNMPPKVITSALAVGLVESNLKNLASEAVPESKNYPNDGIAPGDHDSVGIFQQRRSTQSAGVDTETAMDPVWQINTYYDHVEKQANWRNTDPGTLAADVQSPREDLRGKYTERIADAEALLRTYGASADGAAGIGGRCGTPGSGDLPSGPAGTLAKNAVAAALSQVGKPYVWGAEGPNAYDCSGLTRWAYLRASGGKVGLPHYTGDSGNPGQLAVGIEVPDEKSLQPGDLILYNGSRTQASHVALYIGDGKVVQAQTEGTPVLVTPISGGGKVVMMRRIPDNAGPDGKVDPKKAGQSR